MNEWRKTSGTGPGRQRSGTNIPKVCSLRVDTFCSNLLVVRSNATVIYTAHIIIILQCLFYFVLQLSCYGKFRFRCSAKRSTRLWFHVSNLVVVFRTMLKKCSVLDLYFQHDTLAASQISGTTPAAGKNDTNKFCSLCNRLDGIHLLELLPVVCRLIYFYIFVLCF